MTTSPFAFLPQDELDLSPRAQARRDALRNELQGRVAARGRRQRQRRVAIVSCVLAAAVSVGLLRPWEHTSRPTAAPLALDFATLPTRAAGARRLVEPVVTAPGVVARMRAKPARHRVLTLPDEELGTWLRAVGLPPARLVVGGRSTVLAFGRDRSE